MTTQHTRMVTLQIRLSENLLQRIDAYRDSLTMNPSRSMVIRFLVENAMAILETEREKDGQDC
jgi:metal-responsive CopG/Arc/MetJ family transcriptional regulator